MVQCSCSDCRNRDVVATSRDAVRILKSWLFYPSLLNLLPSIYNSMTSFDPYNRPYWIKKKYLVVFIQCEKLYAKSNVLNLTLFPRTRFSVTAPGFPSFLPLFFQGSTNSRKIVVVLVYKSEECHILSSVITVITFS